jgi:hypothetical protein
MLPVHYCFLSDHLSPLLEELLASVGVRLDGLSSGGPVSRASFPIMVIAVLEGLDGPDNLVNAAMSSEERSNE